MWSVFYGCEGRACAVPSISIAVEVGTRGHDAGHVAGGSQTSC